MKIGIISFEYYPENVGVGNAATNFATGLKKLGHDVYVLCPRKDKLHKRYELINDVKVYRLGRDKKTFIPIFGQLISLLFIFQATRKLRFIKPDVIIGEGWNHQSGVVSGYAGRKLNIISMMRGHATMDAYNSSFSGFRRRLFDKAFRTNNIILATNDKLKVDIEKMFSRNVRILPNCYLNMDHSKPEFIQDLRTKYLKTNKISDVKMNLLAVGRLEEIKGFEYLLSAMKELPNCYLNIIGRGSLETRLMQIKRDLKLDNVNFVGFIDNKFVKEYMYISDLLIMPSIHEGLSMTLIEAMVLKLAIVTTLNDGTRNLISHKKNGYIIETKSYRSIITAINELNEDKKLLEKIRENANKTLKENFSPEAIEKQFVKILMEYKLDHAN